MQTLNTISALDAICVVMVETTLPANIGSAARAMMTMGLSQLTVVNPKQPIDADSYAYAKGGQAILDNARIVNCLDDALRDATLVIAASARNRHLPRPMLSPASAAVLIDDFIQAQQKLGAAPRVALLFGREDRGLTNDELACAHYHLQIPASPAYPVLNVASSIQVTAASLYAHFYAQADLHHSDNTPKKQQKRHSLAIYPRQDWDEAAICHDELVQLNHTLLRLMGELRLTKHDELATLPNRLARLSQRLQLDKKEYALIMASLQRLIKMLGQSTQSS